MYRFNFLQTFSRILFHTLNLTFTIYGRLRKKMDNVLAENYQDIFLPFF